MTVTAELFANPATANPVVTSGGTTTPASGTSESWTVTGLSAFPAISNAASPPTYLRCTDPAQPTEILWITNISGTTVTITRGAESTTTVNHGSNFQLENLITAGGLGNFAQGWPGEISTLAAKSAAYTLTAADYVVVCNATTAAFTVTLPTAVGALGRTYKVKKTDSSANAVTVATTSSQTIDGATTYSLVRQWQFIEVVSDGANWQVIDSVTLIDTTAADIQALGTQAAGNSTQAAAGNHVHAMPRLDQVAAPTAAVALGSQKITGLANGTASTDAAAFGQIPSLAPYAPLAGATFTGAVTLTSLAEAVTSQTSNYSAGSNDAVILCDATSAAFTVTLPTAAGITGRLYTIKKTDTSSNLVTVACTSTQKIDGIAALELGPRQWVQVVSDGTNWQVVAEAALERHQISMTSTAMTTQTLPTAMSQVMNIGANEVAVGTEFEIEIDGVIFAPTAGTGLPAFTFGLYIDGTSTQAGSNTGLGGVYLTPIGSTFSFTLTYRLQILTVGSSGSCTVVSVGTSQAAGANAGNTGPQASVALGSNSNGGVTINTTTTHTLRICGAWGSTTATGHHASSNRTRMTRRLAS
jgi:hypothetical protein